MRARRARSRWEPPARALQVRAPVRSAEPSLGEPRSEVRVSVGGRVLPPAALGRVAALFADCRHVGQVRVGKFPVACFPLGSAGRKTPRGTLAGPFGVLLKTQMQIQLGEVWFGSSPLC